MDKEKWNWSLSIGFYPGVLFGTRAYEEDHSVTYVFYIPFIDIACLLYTSPSPRDAHESRMPSSA